MADAFRFRFSTKYYDVETGLYYYGYRFYSPELGRWMSRDPIEEEGDTPNLYSMVKNDPLDSYDAFDLFGDGQRALGPYVWEWQQTGFYDVKGEPISERVQILVPLGHSDFMGGDEFDFSQEDKGLTAPWFQPWRHFRPEIDSVNDVREAMKKCPCDKEMFERAMHRGQDSFAHRGYLWAPLRLKFGHLFAETDPDADQSRWYEAKLWTIPFVREWHAKCDRKRP